MSNYLSFLHTQIEDAGSGVRAQIQAAKDNTRLTATLDLIINMQTNDHWRENRLKFVSLRDQSDGLKKHSLATTDDAMCIRSQLNQYEIIAIGIHSGILDEGMYRGYYKGTTIRDWDASIEFVRAERVQNSRYWAELEKLIDTLKGR